MKILFCTNVFEVVENGPVKFARLLPGINQLYPAHEVHILTEDTHSPDSTVHQVFMKERWKKSFLSQIIRMWVYHKAAMRLRKNFAFDILIYNNALVGLWSARQFPGTIGMINDDNNIGYSVRNFQPSALWLKRWIFGMAEKHTARLASKVIVNSEYLKKKITASYNLPSEKVHRLYKGIDLSSDKTALKTIDTDQPVKVLFVKNDYRRGGLPILAKALEKLSFRFQLTVVGTNEKDLPVIQSLFSDSTNVQLSVTGKKSEDEVYGYMQNADVFCVPSLKEALGVANLEAMACGLPVVTTDAGGIPEILDNGLCGWMVPPGNPDALAAALQECIVNTEIRHMKIKNGYERIRLFSKEHLFVNFLTIVNPDTYGK